MRKSKHGILRTLVLTVIALVLLIIIVPLFVRFSIDLTERKAVVESAVSEVLGREVKVAGAISVTTSLWPYFEINGISIANPEGFEKGDTASMELAQVSVGLLHLLQKKIRVRKFVVKGLALNLRRNEAGAVNWAFKDLAVEPAQPDKPGMPLSGKLAVDDLSLENITVRFRDDFIHHEVKYSIERAKGSAAFGEPMKLSMNGALLDIPFTMKMKANSLGEFLSMTHARLETDIELAQTRIHFSGSSDTQGDNSNAKMMMSIEGDRLDSLDDLLGLDLPPLEDYRLSANLDASKGRLELGNIEVTVKNSTLKGNVVIDNTGAKPFATVDLSADSIQLTDFETVDWSPDEQVSQQEKSGSDSKLDAGRAKFLSQEALQRVNARWSVKVHEVLSGKDTLGNGEWSIELKDGRLTLDALRLNLPNSKLLLKASVKPDRVASPASLRLLVENFDIGVLTRLSNPDSQVSGPLNIDLDITSSTNGIRGFLKGANGYFDISGNPQNTSSKAVDLWAINLLSSVVESSAKKESDHKVNCLISRWSLVNGLMTSQNVAVDTSKIRICMKGDIDFNQQTIQLRAIPTAKRPEFFSLATPVAVNGQFEDFRVGAQMGVLAVVPTTVKFAISPITTPLKRLISDDLPADGADICSLPIGPREGDLKKLPGC